MCTLLITPYGASACEMLKEVGENQQESLTRHGCCHRAQVYRDKSVGPGSLPASKRQYFSWCLYFSHSHLHLTAPAKGAGQSDSMQAGVSWQCARISLAWHGEAALEFMSASALSLRKLQVRVSWLWLTRFVKDSVSSTQDKTFMVSGCCEALFEFIIPLMRPLLWGRRTRHQGPWFSLLILHEFWSAPYSRSGTLLGTLVLLPTESSQVPCSRQCFFHNVFQHLTSGCAERCRKQCTSYNVSQAKCRK